MEVLQRYTCTARPFLARASPAPHTVCNPDTKSTLAPASGRPNGRHRIYNMYIFIKRYCTKSTTKRIYPHLKCYLSIVDHDLLCNGDRVIPGSGWAGSHPSRGWGAALSWAARTAYAAPRDGCGTARRACCPHAALRTQRERINCQEKEILIADSLLFVNHILQIKQNDKDLLMFPRNRCSVI